MAASEATALRAEHAASPSSSRTSERSVNQQHAHDTTINNSRGLAREQDRLRGQRRHGSSVRAARVCMSECVFWYNLCTECQDTHSTSKARTFLLRNDILSGCSVGFKGRVTVGFRRGLGGQGVSLSYDGQG